jgi:hypothetical protein
LGPKGNEAERFGNFRQWPEKKQRKGVSGYIQRGCFGVTENLIKRITQRNKQKNQVFYIKKVNHRNLSGHLSIVDPDTYKYKFVSENLSSKLFHDRP